MNCPKCGVQGKLLLGLELPVSFQRCEEHGIYNNLLNENGAMDVLIEKLNKEYEKRFEKELK
jgi:dynactin complex subunit